MTRAGFFDVVIDPNGRPIRGVSVAMYDTGTTNPYSGTIWAGPTASTTLSNPFIANDQGEVQFWLVAPTRVDLAYSKDGYTGETETVDAIDTSAATTAVAAEAAARAAADALLIPLAQRGAASGVATLDGSTTVPDAQIPATIARDTETTAAVAAEATARATAVTAEATARGAADTAHAASATAHSGTYVEGDVRLTVAATAPSSPDVNDMWLDSDATSTQEHTHSGTYVAIADYVKSFRPANTMVLIGDSFIPPNHTSDATTVQHNAAGMFTFGNMLLDQRLKPTAFAGVGGNTTAQMLARFATDVVAVAPAWVFIGGGTNDYPSSALTVAQTESNLGAMFDLADAAGIRVVTATLPPRDLNGTTENAKLFEINRWIKDQARTRPNLVLVDFYSTLAVPDTGAYVSGLSDDGIHPNILGGMRLGRAFANVMDALLPPFDGLPESNLDTFNLLTNGMVTGTGGILGAGVTGSVAALWAVESMDGNAVVAVASKVARTDLGPGEMQQVTVTSGWTRARMRVLIAGTNFAVGDTVYGQCGFESDADWVGVTSFRCECRAYDVSTNLLFQGMDLSHTVSPTFETLNRPAAGVFRTPSFVVPAGTVRLELLVALKGAGTFRVKQAEIVEGTYL